MNRKYNVGIRGAELWARMEEDDGIKKGVQQRVEKTKCQGGDKRPRLLNHCLHL